MRSETEIRIKIEEVKGKVFNAPFFTRLIFKTAANLVIETLGWVLSEGEL